MSKSYWQRLSRRQRKGVAWLAGLFVFYTLVGFLVLPMVIRWQALEQLPKVLKRDVTVREVRVNPWALSMAVRGLEVTEPDGGRFAAWEEFYVNFQVSSLFRWAWTFKEVRLVNPFGSVIVFEDGRPNFADLLEGESAEPAADTTSPGVPRIGVGRLELTNGVFMFEDRTLRSPFRTEYRPINLILNAFKTSRDARSPHSFTAVSDAGKRISWSGDMTVQPLRGAGIFEMTKIDLARYRPYLEETIRARLTEAMAEVHLEYRFESGTNGTDLVVSNGVVRLANLRFTDPVTEEDPLAVDNIELDQFQMDLRSRSARMGSITIAGARILARMDAEGGLNLAQLFQPVLPEDESSPATAGSESDAGGGWEIEVEKLRVGGSLTFEDIGRATPFRTTLAPIEIGVDRFNTRTNAEGEFRFNIETEAAETLAGEGVFSVTPPRSQGEVHLAGIELGKYAPYFEGEFRGQINGGRLAVDIPYRVAMGSDDVQAGVTNLVLEVRDLVVMAPDASEPAIAVPLFGVEVLDASFEDRRVRVGRVHSNDGTIDMRRSSDGRLNLAELVAVASKESESEEPTETGEGQAWAVGVDEVVIEGYRLSLRDESLPRVAELSLDQLAFEVRGLSSDVEEPLETAVSLRFNPSGEVSVRGTVTPQPATAALGLSITNLDLAVFGPYVEAYARLGIRGGKFDLTGQASLQTGDDGAAGGFAGSLKVREFLSTDLTVLEPLIGWDELSVAGIDLKSRPPGLFIDEIRWAGLAGHVIVDADGRMNLAGMMVPAGQVEGAVDEVAPAEAPADGAGEPMSMRVGLITLDEAAFSFEDRSITPRAMFGIQELTGTIRGISSEPGAMAELDLRASVDGQSPLSIQGHIDPLGEGLSMDLAITNRDLQLTAFSPYMEKYAGYPLVRGRLSVDMRYRVQAEQLSAENGFQIDQLTLGSRNDSPDATGLPVKLGIALLKDREGRIDLKIPVKGRLDDPEFRVAPLIGKVVLNTIAKAATSPFSLLGALVGGGEELSFIEFNPGGTNVVEGELEKLDKLARALDQRPALNVDLQGGVDPARDGPPLRLAKLRQQIRAHRLKELEVRGDSMASAPDFVIDPIDYERLLRVRFQEESGDQPAAGIEDFQGGVTNAPVTVPAEVPGEEARPTWGLLRRALAVVGIGRRGGRPPATEERVPEATPGQPGELTVEAMETRLAEKVPIAAEDFVALMKARTQCVRDALTGQGGVPADRLFLVAPKVPSLDAAGESRVQLLLN